MFRFDSVSLFRILPEEARRAGFWVLLFGAILFLFIATIWEGIYLKEPPLPPAAWYFDRKNYISFLKEMGFALLIAWVVAFVIERSSKQRQEVAAMQMQQTIARDVFEGIFGNFLPQNVTQTFIDRMLTTSVIRDHMELIYVINDVQPTRTRGALVEIEISARYIIRNVSKETYRVPLRVVIELLHTEDLQTYGRLRRFTVTRGKEEIDLTARLNKSGVTQGTSVGFYEEESLEAGAEMRVVYSYKKAKDRVGAEVWSTFYPTSYLSLNIVMNAKNMKLAANAL